MSSFCYRDNRFLFVDADREQVLLDCNDVLSNKSRVSMHRLLGQDFLTIPTLLLDLAEREDQENKDLAFPAILLDTLLATQLIRTRHPIKMLEYGSLDGQFSWHIAELLSTFHPESSLVCAHDAIELEWLQRMDKARCLPKLSYFAGDFGELLLQQNSFDVVLINGRVNFFEPQSVILDAVRLAKNDGMIICYCDSTPLLESTFKLMFETREEFEIAPSQVIFVKKLGGLAQ